MSETVFWDTAAIVALGNARDELHHRAIRVSEELAAANSHVLTTDAVLIEVANTFSFYHSSQFQKPRCSMSQTWELSGSSPAAGLTRS